MRKEPFHEGLVGLFKSTAKLWINTSKRNVRLSFLEEEK